MPHDAHNTSDRIEFYQILLRRMRQKLTPSIVKKFQRLKRDKKLKQEFSNLTNREIFEKIYFEERWGTNQTQNRKYSSGAGTRDTKAVTDYVEAISEFLLEFSDINTALDVGCGDFTVGSRISYLFKHYTAVDVAENVINENKQLFRDLGVDFYRLDITLDNLPPADVVFARQVLQHLSNDNIIRFLKRLNNKFRILILTESISSSHYFTANIDIFTGPGIRIHKKSGVILEASPFNLEALDIKELLRYKNGKEIILTKAYILPHPKN